MSEFATLTIKRSGALATVSFNRPEKLNAFDAKMRGEFVVAARQVNCDPDIRVVILTGAGRAFGVGADLSEVSDDGAGASGVATEDMLNHEFKAGILGIADSPKVWIAAINGPCAGVSYSYAMACDMALMAESAYLYQPFAAIGLVPDGGATWLLSQAVGHRRAIELMLLGEKLPAAKALDWGLVNRVFPDADFQSGSEQFANDVAGRAPLALRYTKEALRFAATGTLTETISKEAALQSTCIESEDCRGAVNAFLSKSTYEWKGR